MLETNQTSLLWKSIWGASIIPKVKNYIWRLVSNAVGVKVSLIKRGMHVDSSYSICGDDETTVHMVIGCRWTEPLWDELMGIRLNVAVPTNITSLMENKRREGNGHTTLQTGAWVTCMLATWFIWKARCKIEFEGVQPNPTSVMAEIK